MEVTVSTSSKAEKISDFKLTNPLRYVIDVSGATLKTPSKEYAVNVNGISKIRLGDDGERARIVLDAEKIDKASVKVNDNAVIIYVNSDVAAVNTTPPAVTGSSGKTESKTDNSSEKTESIPVTKYSDTDKLIVLDAGHGGTDPGAIGTLDGESVNEKDLTLAIVLKTRDILKSKGYKVELTRSKDTYPTLSERAKFANDSNAAIFVSVHINSSVNPEPFGTEVYYADINNGDDYGIKSSALAKALLNKLTSALNSESRGVKSSNHLVTRESLMPASLVEIGFISNEEELKKMMTDSYQQKAAQAIADAIISQISSVTVPRDKTQLKEDREKALKEWESTR